MGVRQKEKPLLAVGLLYCNHKGLQGYKSQLREASIARPVDKRSSCGNNAWYCVAYRTPHACAHRCDHELNPLTCQISESYNREEQGLRRTQRVHQHKIYPRPQVAILLHVEWIGSVVERRTQRSKAEPTQRSHSGFKKSPTSKFHPCNNYTNFVNPNGSEI